MNDPYSVLGVSKNATDDEIKQAYRELARKYHPDNYVNNPLSDLVEEKMKEINEAYDRIRKERSESSYSYSSGGNSSAYSGEFINIRDLINANRLSEAETLLDAIPYNVRNGEWNYLKGCILEKKGWYFDAQKFFETACYIDPDNKEYRDALHRIRANANSFGGYRQANNNSGCSMCDICSALICADCCCECMGGDLIRCC